ncbi:MAG: 3-methyladenine DNA glycosylase AlkD [Chlamydiales bacterium]|jgi:3-methyladenine DNA glycosylase AlkD
MDDYLYDDAMINELEDLFRQNSRFKIAQEQSEIMENMFPFFGLENPKRSSLQDTIFPKYPIRDEATLLSTVEQLWDEDEREYQYAGCDLAERYLAKCTLNSLPFFEKLIREKSHWDTVDKIAANLVGKLLLRYPDKKMLMDKWIDDPDIWIRRAALFYQLEYKDKTDEDILFSYCIKTMREKDLVIREAIGLVLQKHSQTSPQSVREFIENHRLSLSPLTVREGMKLLK